MTNQIPAFDYEEAKDFYFDKLQADRTGKGRMESALFHTAQFIFDKGCHRQEALLQETEKLAHYVRHLQAQIDSLMLEYCPDEMAPEQIAEWERNQQSVTALVTSVQK